MHVETLQGVVNEVNRKYAERRGAKVPNTDSLFLPVGVSNLYIQKSGLVLASFVFLERLGSIMK